MLAVLATLLLVGVLWNAAWHEPTHEPSDFRPAPGPRSMDAGGSTPHHTDSTKRIAITTSKNNESTRGELGSLITGRVKTRSGHAIPRAGVVLTASSRSWAVRASDDGTFRHRLAWESGRESPVLTAWAAGYRPTHRPLSDHRRALLSNGATIKVDLVLEPGATITGRVLFHSKPVEKARVDVVCEDANATPAKTLARTDPSGRFYAAALPNAYYRMAVSSGRTVEGSCSAQGRPTVPSWTSATSIWIP